MLTQAHASELQTRLEAKHAQAIAMATEEHVAQVLLLQERLDLRDMELEGERRALQRLQEVHCCVCFSCICLKLVCICRSLPGRAK